MLVGVFTSFVVRLARCYCCRCRLVVGVGRDALGGSGVVGLSQLVCGDGVWAGWWGDSACALGEWGTDFFQVGVGHIVVLGWKLDD